MAADDSTRRTWRAARQACVSLESACARHDGAHRVDRIQARGGAPPGRADHAVGRGRRKGPHGQAARRGEWPVGRESRQEREAEARRDHLPQASRGWSRGTPARPCRRARRPRAPGRAGNGLPRAAAASRPRGRRPSRASSPRGGGLQASRPGRARRTAGAWRGRWVSAGSARIARSSSPASVRSTSGAVWYSCRSSESFGKRLRDLRRDARQEVGPERRDQPDFEGPRERVLARAREAADVVRIPEHAPRPRDHRLARGRQRGAPRLALDEGDAEVFLELAQLGRQGRLGDMAALGRTAEMPRFGERDEVFEVPQVHSRSLSKPSLHSIVQMERGCACCTGSKLRQLQRAGIP